MRFEVSLLAVTLLALVLLSSSPAGVAARPSFWDSIPIVSQVKSLTQAAAGDSEGAKKTQENFVNRAPVVSQVKSAVQAARGDNQGAKKTQEEFLNEFVIPAADNTPIVGHIKGGVHMLQGDREKGKEVLKDATKSTIAIAAASQGGPVGAAVAGSTWLVNKAR